jgi:hypothetical protein
LPFTEIFKGFERVQAVREVFGEDTEKVIGRLKVAMIPSRYMYMGVNDQDGNLGVGTYHLEHSDLRVLYLDVVHELFHVGQYMRDREWFGKEHRRYLKKGFDTSLYYRSPIEIPAYRHAAVEAQRIGMSHDEIVEYLKIGPVDPKVFAGFMEAMKLRPATTAESRVRIPVQINRRISAPKYRFADYFVGFEKLPAVKAVLGEGVDATIGGLKVVFSPGPFGFISLNEEDGNLEVGSQYLKDGDERLMYMDVVLCLNLLKRLSEKSRKPDADRESYGRDPAVIKAYEGAVAEARRVGVSDSEILEHLSIMRFVMPPPAFEEFVKTLGLEARK